MLKKWPIRVVLYVVLPAFGSLVLGTFCHEVLGHGLTGLLLGGRIERVHVLGLRIGPGVRWEGWTGQYGYCEVTSIVSTRNQQWDLLAGSLSTLCVAIIAITLLWIRSWSPAARVVLAWLSAWWIDILTYTLPTWGIRRSILWGGTRSEPYDAAVALGMPGWLFQTLLLVSSAALTFLLWKRLCAAKEKLRSMAS